MTDEPIVPTRAQVKAARMMVRIDADRGRETPDDVKEIAEFPLDRAAETPRRNPWPDRPPDYVLVWR